MLAYELELGYDVVIFLHSFCVSPKIKFKAEHPLILSPSSFFPLPHPFPLIFSPLMFFPPSHHSSLLIFSSSLFLLFCSSHPFPLILSFSSFPPPPFFLLLSTSFPPPPFLILPLILSSSFPPVHPFLIFYPTTSCPSHPFTRFFRPYFSLILLPHLSSSVSTLS